ncbi:MAG: hypothetical protein ACQESR_19760 [Planctomycetota bacterium]
MEQECSDSWLDFNRGVGFDGGRAWAASRDAAGSWRLSRRIGCPGGALSGARRWNNPRVRLAGAFERG